MPCDEHPDCVAADSVGSGTAACRPGLDVPSARSVGSQRSRESGLVCASFGLPMTRISDLRYRSALKNSGPTPARRGHRLGWPRSPALSGSAASDPWSCATGSPTSSRARTDGTRSPSSPGTPLSVIPRSAPTASCWITPPIDPDLTSSDRPPPETNRFVRRQRRSHLLGRPSHRGPRSRGDTISLGALPRARLQPRSRSAARAATRDRPPTRCHQGVRPWRRAAHRLQEQDRLPRCRGS